LGIGPGLTAIGTPTGPERVANIIVAGNNIQQVGTCKVFINGKARFVFNLGWIGILTHPDMDHMTGLYRLRGQEKIPIEDSIRLGSKIWEGVQIDSDYDHLVIKLTLMKGTEETIRTLKEAGYLVGCISSGVSQFFMEPLTKRLGLDFAHSNILSTSDGAHSGTVEYAMGGPQKAETALQILQERGLSTKNLVSIGDGTNDIDLFGVSAFSIAFNPENEDVSGAATITIHSKNLESILEHFI